MQLIFGEPNSVKNQCDEVLEYKPANLLRCREIAPRRGSKVVMET